MNAFGGLGVGARQVSSSDGESRNSFPLSARANLKVTGVRRVGRIIRERISSNLEEQLLRFKGPAVFRTLGFS